MSKEKNTVSLLNSLLEKNCDAKRGYQKAAEDIDQPTIKGWLMSLAEQRENFKKSIKEEIRFLGGEPEIFRQVSGKIQQTFSNADLLLILSTLEPALEECLQYEIESLAEYEQLLQQKTVIPSTHNLIIGQRENIKVALSDLEAIMTDSSYSL